MKLICNNNSRIRSPVLRRQGHLHAVLRWQPTVEWGLASKEGDATEGTRQLAFIPYGANEAGERLRSLVAKSALQDGRDC